MTGTGRSGGNRKPAKLAPTNNWELPEKPATLSDAAAMHWDKLIRMLPENVLRPVDGFELSILATLLAQSDHLAAKLKDNPGDASSNRLFLQTFKEIHRLSACFGLNPHDRQRLNLGSDEDENDPFLAYLAAT